LDAGLGEQRISSMIAGRPIGASPGSAPGRAIPLFTDKATASCIRAPAN